MNRSNGTSVPLPQVRDAVAEHVAKTLWILAGGSLFVIAFPGDRLVVAIYVVAVVGVANAVIGINRWRRDRDLYADGDR